jgi:hypothetical protein
MPKALGGANDDLQILKLLQQDMQLVLIVL